MTKGSAPIDFVFPGCRELAGAPATPLKIGEGPQMPLSAHPTAELRRQYRDGTCSAGAALAVATHLILCPDCAGLHDFGAWGGLNLPVALAANHGCYDEASIKAFGAGVVEEWRCLGEGTRLAAMTGLGSVGEAVHLAEISIGASLVLAGAIFYIVVLQGRLSDGVVLFERGALVDMMLTPLVAPKGAGDSRCICLVVSDDSGLGTEH